MLFWGFWRLHWKAGKWDLIFKLWNIESKLGRYIRQINEMRDTRMCIIVWVTRDGHVARPSTRQVQKFCQSPREFGALKGDPQENSLPLPPNSSQKTSKTRNPLTQPNRPRNSKIFKIFTRILRILRILLLILRLPPLLNAIRHLSPRTCQSCF